MDRSEICVLNDDEVAPAPSGRRLPRWSTLLKRLEAEADGHCLVAGLSALPQLSRDPTALLSTWFDGAALRATVDNTLRSGTEGLPDVFFFTAGFRARLLARLVKEAPRSDVLFGDPGGHLLLLTQLLKEGGDCLDARFLRLNLLAPVSEPAQVAWDAADEQVEVADHAARRSHDIALEISDAVARRCQVNAETSRLLSCAVLAPLSATVDDPDPGLEARDGTWQLVEELRVALGLWSAPSVHFFARVLRAQRRRPCWATLHAACAASLSRSRTPLAAAMATLWVAIRLLRLRSDAQLTARHLSPEERAKVLHSAAAAKTDRLERAMRLVGHFGRDLHERHLISLPMLQYMLAAATMQDVDFPLDDLLQDLKAIPIRETASAA
jgi:hypothetical protein